MRNFKLEIRLSFQSSFSERKQILFEGGIIKNAEGIFYGTLKISEMLKFPTNLFAIIGRNIKKMEYRYVIFQIEGKPYLLPPYIIDVNNSGLGSFKTAVDLAKDIHFYDRNFFAKGNAILDLTPANSVLVKATKVYEIKNSEIYRFSTIRDILEIYDTSLDLI